MLTLIKVRGSNRNFCLKFPIFHKIKLVIRKMGSNKLAGSSDELVHYFMLLKCKPTRQKGEKKNHKL